MKKKLRNVFFALCVAVSCVSVSCQPGLATNDSVHIQWTDKQIAVHEIAEQARSLGLSEDNPIIVECQRIWWEEYDTVLSVQEEQVDTSDWNELYVKVTAYCPCRKCNGSYYGKPTASGTELTVGRTIAVDPKVIPLGSSVEIDGHIYTAEDTGSSVKGATIDLLMATHDEANEWGIKYKTVRWR